MHYAKGADCVIACLNAQKQARVALLQPLGVVAGADLNAFIHAAESRSFTTAGRVRGQELPGNRGMCRFPARISESKLPTPRPSGGSDVAQRTVGEARERHPTARFELLRQSRPDRRGAHAADQTAAFGQSGGMATVATRRTGLWLRSWSVGSTAFGIEIGRTLDRHVRSVRSVRRFINHRKHLIFSPLSRGAPTVEAEENG
jgi:hypothetical protein